MEAGRGEQSDGSDSWTGTDPRKTLKKTTAGGIMGLVVPKGEVPSRNVFTTPELPSHGKTGSDAEWEDIEFDDIDDFENRLKPDSDDIVSRLSDNFMVYIMLLKTSICILTVTETDRLSVRLSI